MTPIIKPVKMGISVDGEKEVRKGKLMKAKERPTFVMATNFEEEQPK